MAIACINLASDFFYFILNKNGNRKATIAAHVLYKGKNLAIVFSTSSIVLLEFNTLYN
jgi:hypothetical protein